MATGYQSNELRLLVANFTSNSGAPQIWSLQGEDANTTVDAANFITDALVRGMRKGDIVYYTQWSALPAKTTLSNVTIHSVVTVASTGADLSNLLSVTQTNTD